MMSKQLLSKPMAAELLRATHETTVFRIERIHWSVRSKAENGELKRAKAWLAANPLPRRLRS